MQATICLEFSKAINMQCSLKAQSNTKLVICKLTKQILAILCQNVPLLYPPPFLPPSVSFHDH